ncbi:MAG TPA: hypothetical protein VFC79_03695 [Tissierellaceae bacterium]|nr:hypothetical protein [Tissierellaceae bacterium]
MNDRELLELIAAQVGTLTNQVGTLTNQVDTFTNDMQDIKQRIRNVEKDTGEIKHKIVKMEDDNHRNFTALFDGYKQNSEQLNRIEDEVSKHEEVFIRKIK